MSISAVPVSYLCISIILLPFTLLLRANAKELRRLKLDGLILIVVVFLCLFNMYADDQIARKFFHESAREDRQKVLLILMCLTASAGFLGLYLGALIEKRAERG